MVMAIIIPDQLGMCDSDQEQDISDPPVNNHSAKQWLDSAVIIENFSLTTRSIVAPREKVMNDGLKWMEKPSDKSYGSAQRSGRELIYTDWRN